MEGKSREGMHLKNNSKKKERPRPSEALSIASSDKVKI